MNQQEFDIKTEEKTPTNVSDFRLREKSLLRGEQKWTVLSEQKWTVVLS